MSMKPMTIEQYEALTRHDRASAALDGSGAETRPLFPVTEREAARLLNDCGFKGAKNWLEHFRESGDIAATEDAWGRAAVADAWNRMAEMGAVISDVFACHSMDVSYHDFWVAYLAACERIRAEYGDVAPVAGMFGRHELVSFESFVKVFHPIRGTEDGVIPGRVEFVLADDTRAAFEAAKAGK